MSGVSSRVCYVHRTEHGSRRDVTAFLLFRFVLYIILLQFEIKAHSMHVDLGLGCIVGRDISKTCQYHASQHERDPRVEKPIPTVTPVGK